MLCPMRYPRGGVEGLTETQSCGEAGGGEWGWGGGGSGVSSGLTSSSQLGGLWEQDSQSLSVSLWVFCATPSSLQLVLEWEKPRLKTVPRRAQT